MTTVATVATVATPKTRKARKSAPIVNAPVAADLVPETPTDDALTFDDILAAAEATLAAMVPADTDTDTDTDTVATTDENATESATIEHDALPDALAIYADSDAPESATDENEHDSAPSGLVVIVGTPDGDAADAAAAAADGDVTVALPDTSGADGAVDATGDALPDGDVTVALHDGNADLTLRCRVTVIDGKHVGATGYAKSIFTTKSGARLVDVIRDDDGRLICVKQTAARVDGPAPADYRPRATASAPRDPNAPRAPRANATSRANGASLADLVAAVGRLTADGLDALELEIGARRAWLANAAAIAAEDSANASAASDDTAAADATATADENATADAAAVLA